jgi:hypothetical protein
MTKKRLLLLASLPLTIAVTLGVLAMLPPPRAGFVKANYVRIQEGMTLAEVEEIFGKKATSWRNDSHALWIDDEGYAGILFIDNRVSDHYCQDYGNNCNPTLFQNIRRWLHLPQP